MKLVELLEDTIEDCNTLRSIVAILDKPETYMRWNASTPKQQEVLRKAVKKNNKAKVLEWVKKHPSRTLYEYTRVELVELARKHRIANYSRIERIELIEALNEKIGKDSIHPRPDDEGKQPRSNPADDGGTGNNTSEVHQ